MASRYGFQTQEERENEKKRAAEAEAVPASDFALEVPSRLTQALKNRTGIKLVDRVKFLDAQDN